MKRIIFIIFAFLIIFFFFGCTDYTTITVPFSESSNISNIIGPSGGRDCIEGSDYVIETSRDVRYAFHSIEIQTAADVEISQGAQKPLTVSAEDNLIPLIITEVVDGVLIIKHDEGVCFTTHRPIKISLSMEEVKKLTILGSGDFESRDQISADDLKLLIIGSGDIDLDVAAENIYTTITGSGDITLKGTADVLDSTISGSSNPSCVLALLLAVTLKGMSLGAKVVG